MAERMEEPEVEVDAGASDLSAAAALAVGLRRSRSKRSDQDAKLDTYLDEQTRLVRLQTEHLHEQRELQLAHLRVRRWKDRLSLALQALGVIGGAAIVLAVAVMAWQAHEDHGLVIEAFSVPPDLAARGLSGEVIANQILDRLKELEADTVTGRPAATYADDWGGDIKVEIPETGVSIGELNRYLRQWLGRATRITGEVWRAPTGLALTARAGEASGKTFEGAEADLKSLIQQGAEAIYSGTQPYRYAVYLQTHGQPGQAAMTFARLATSGPPEDRPWANAAWSTVLLDQGDQQGAALHAREALKDRITSAYGNLIQADGALSHDEDMLDAARIAARASEVRPNPDLPNGADQLATRGAIALMHGDYQTAAAKFGAFGNLVAGAIRLEGRAAAIRTRPRQVEALALDHDVSAARRLLAGLDTPAAHFSLVTNGQTAQVVIDQQMEDWRAAAGHLEALVASIQDLGPMSRQVVHRRDWSHLAVAYSHLGRLSDADRMVALTPLDCDDCLRARGEIAAIQHDRAGADGWYAAAARHAPSSPFPHTDWGRALLAMGALDDAIAKFKEAHRRGPRFADPLELWGEALMAKRNYADAVGEYAEADKYAPRWGRNHLRWGEALMLSGRYGEARRQYETANGLDLSKADRAALGLLLARTARGTLHG
jgi:tetratricopeptide (TPR) repeat protein